MPRLPSEMDYGARPSVRTNRIDMPDKSGVEFAESLAAAANTFATVAAQQQQKQNRANYSMAKNEILIAEMEEREKLEDRDDWEAFDEDYTQAFNSRRDAIAGKYNFSGSDRTLLYSDTDLIRERGRLDVQDLVKARQMDLGRANLYDSLDTFLGKMQSQGPEKQHELMGQAHEAIDAAVEKKWLTEEEGEAQRQAFVVKAVAAALEFMSSEERLQELELSRAHRVARGHLTPEQILNGEGSGSIADFVHLNIVERLIREAETENELETELAIAQSIVDEVADNNPGRPADIENEVRRLAKERNLTAKQRARAEAVAAERATEISQARNAQYQDQANSVLRMLQEKEELDDGRFVHKYSLHDRERGADDLKKMMIGLPPAMVDAIREKAAQIGAGEQFGDYDQIVEAKIVKDADGNDVVIRPSYKYWSDLPPDEKAKINLEDPLWRYSFTAKVWLAMDAEQKTLQKAKGEKAHQNNDQILRDVQAEVNPEKVKEDDVMHLRVRGEYMTELDTISDDQYQGQAVPDAVRKELARKIYGRTVWERKVFWDKEISIGDVDITDAGDYYVPIAQLREMPDRPAGEITYINERGEERTALLDEPLPWDKFLKRWGMLHGIPAEMITERRIETAFAQFSIPGSEDEKNARVLAALRGEL